MDSIAGRYNGGRGLDRAARAGASSGEAKAAGEDGEPPDTFADLLKMIDMLNHASIAQLQDDARPEEGQAPRISPPMF